jgi:phosphate transport system substrate-binding protein
MPGAPFVPASAENALNGSYPLARLLYVYVNKPPGKPLDPVADQFLSMAFRNRPGIGRQGWVYPLPLAVAA